MSNPTPVKKNRIRKACDSCNAKRTKCDGDQPCNHCVQVKIECTYLRKERRRGRASDKYPKQIKKRKTHHLKTEDNIFITSKRPEFQILNTLPIKTYTDFGKSKYPVLNAAAQDLKKIGLPYEVADELFEYYFDIQFPPASRVFSILRKSLMMNSSRPTKSNLLLCVLLSSAIQIDHRFFAGSNRDYSCQSLYRMIQENLPSKISLFELDDFICLVHLGFLMPYLSYPSDSVYWWKLGYDVAIHLRLNEPSNDEEKIRGWWGLFILDRLTALSFNLPTIITDAECSNVYLPCDEDIWTNTDQEIPLDESRKKSFDYDYVTSGIFGWALPLAGLMGKFVQYKKCTNFQTKKVLRRDLVKLQSKNLIAIKRFNSNNIDMLYAKYINLALSFVTQDINESEETLGGFDDIVNETHYQKLTECIRALEELLKLDENMHRYPFLLSFFLFLIGVSLLSLLNDVKAADQADVTRVNKYKYFVKILVRVIDTVLITFPGEFLRMVRTQLASSIKDCENLILLNDYIDKFKENSRKRKDALSAYSWSPTGRGIAI